MVSYIYGASNYGDGDNVLILLFVEDGFISKALQTIATDITCLNPTFRGRWFHIIK